MTHHLHDFFDSLSERLRRLGREELVRLVGELVPGKKDRPPLQAADVMLWHLRRWEAGEHDRADARRLGLMLKGKKRTSTGLTHEEISDIGVRAKTLRVPSPFEPKRGRSSGGVAS